MQRLETAALTDAIRRLEAGESVESVLAQYPQYAVELKEELALRSSLDALEREQPEARAIEKGLGQLDGALFERQSQGGRTRMNEVSKVWGFALKLSGGIAIVAAMVAAAAFFSGNLHVQLGSEASALPTHPCLDQVLGNLADPPDGHFDVQDILAFRDAFRTQNTDPRYDRDGDGDVDIDDLMVYIQELRTCLGPGA